MKRKIILIPLVLIIALELLNFEYSTLSNISLGKMEYTSIAIIAIGVLAIILQFKYKKLNEDSINTQSTT